MSVAELKERHVAATETVNSLRERLKHKRLLLLDTDGFVFAVAGYARSQGKSPITFGPTDLVCCRTLQGHTGKVRVLTFSESCAEVRLCNLTDYRESFPLRLHLRCQQFYGIPDALTVGDRVSQPHPNHVHPDRTLQGVAISLFCNSVLGATTADSVIGGAWNQVYSLDWTPEKNRIVSASQDGRLIVWNALTSQKTHAIKLPCAWVMTVPSLLLGRLLLVVVLIGHKGYVSCCQYVPDEDTHLITSSGDQTCVLWDITTGLRTSVFGGEFQSGHTADVLSVSVNGSNSKLFVSGSCDATARLWDTRVASRAMMELAGRLLFAGYSNGDCYVWDTLLAKVVLNLGSLQNSHEGRISCLGLSADGSALCTGSWDTNLKVSPVPTVGIIVSPYVA
ncbi:hypothetical protein C3L33_19517, partial [Rhododendron williamsianum]